MSITASRLISLAAALITLTLMVYMARPWGDNYAYQSLSGYAWLLGFAAWALLPYVMVPVMARRPAPFRAGKVMDTIVMLIITAGAVALYIDAALLHPDPQGALVFITVPPYQWIILALWAGIHFLLTRGQAQDLNRNRG